MKIRKILATGLVAIAMVTTVSAAANDTFYKRFINGATEWSADSTIMTKDDGVAYGYVQVSRCGSAVATTDYMIASDETHTPLLNNVLRLYGNNTTPYTLSYTSDVGVNYNGGTVLLMRPINWDAPYTVEGEWNPHGNVN